MASPRPAANAAAPSTQPLTPPADAPASGNSAPQTTQPATSAAPTPTAAANPPQGPATSLQDTGKSRRPRDARLIHMLLASMGVTAYQERVPLQLLDFAYRYTSSTLQDTVYLVTEGYSGDVTGTGVKAGEGGGKGGQDINISLNALRMSIASRLQYQFQPALPKEFLMEVASERNRILLPGVNRSVYDAHAANDAGAASGIVMGGMRLPPERFCQTGVAWGLREEWESEGEEEMEVDAGTQQNNQVQEKEETAEDEDVDGTMEDIFGDGELDGDQDGDQAMTGI